jgi:hypothetical protein
MPDLDLVAVWIGEEDVGFPGTELTVAANAAAGRFDGLDGSRDVGGFRQPEAEVRHASRLAGMSSALEDEHVAAAGRLCLDEIGLFVDRDGAKDPTVELERALRVFDGQGNVRQAVRLNHMGKIARTGAEALSALPRYQLSAVSSQVEVGSCAVLGNMSDRRSQIAESFRLQSADRRSQ